jgi:hypothetical protein
LSKKRNDISRGEYIMKKMKKEKEEFGKSEESIEGTVLHRKKRKMKFVNLLRVLRMRTHRGVHTKVGIIS